MTDHKIPVHSCGAVIDATRSHSHMFIIREALSMDLTSGVGMELR